MIGAIHAKVAIRELQAKMANDEDYRDPRSQDTCWETQWLLQYLMFDNVDNKLDSIQLFLH